MNSKMCKKLRKAARSMAEAYGNGEPVVERQLHEIEKNRKMVLVPRRNEDGTLVTPMAYDQVAIALGTMVESPTSVKGIYNRLKRVAAAGVPAGNLQPI